MTVTQPAQNRAGRIAQRLVRVVAPWLGLLAISFATQAGPTNTAVGQAHESNSRLPAD